MICRICGTESNGRRCAHCGAPVVNGAFGDPNAAAAAGKKAKKKKPVIHMRAIIWPAVSLMIPLIYLFSDLFVSYSAEMYAPDASGVSKFSLLIDRLSSPAYDGNSFTELVDGVYGMGTKLVKTVSFADYLTGKAMEFTFPMLLIVALSLFSGVMGVLLIITGGRILRTKLMSDLTLFGGFGAAVSPLVANVLVRVFYIMSKGGLAGADEQMRYVGFSIEAVLMMCLAVSSLLPSVGVLRAISAAAQQKPDYVPFPFRLFGKRSFGFCRMLALIFAFAAVLVPVLYLFLPVLNVGSLLNFKGAGEAAFPNLIAQAKALFALIGGTSDVGTELRSLCVPLLDICFFLQLPILFFAMIPVVRSVYRLFTVRCEALYDRRCDRIAMSRAASRLRRPVLVPFLSFTVVQGILLTVLMLASHVTAHVDFSSVEDTLGVAYLMLAYVKSICGTNTLYAVLATLGVLFASLAGNGALQLLSVSAAQSKEQK